MRTSLLFVLLGLLACSTLLQAYPAEGEVNNKSSSSDSSESKEKEGEKKELVGKGIVPPQAREAHLAAEEKEKEKELVGKGIVPPQAREAHEAAAKESEEDEQKSTNVKPWADKDGKAKIKQLKEAQAAEVEAEKALLRLRRALLSPEQKVESDVEDKEQVKGVDRHRHHHGHHRGRHYHRRHHHHCPKPQFLSAMSEQDKKTFYDIKNNEELSREEKELNLKQWASRKGEQVKKQLEDYLQKKEEFKAERKQERKEAVRELPELMNNIEIIIEDEELSMKEKKEKIAKIVPMENKKLLELLETLYPFLELEGEKEEEPKQRSRRNIGQGVEGFGGGERRHHNIGNGVDPKHHKHRHNNNNRDNDMYDAYGRRREQSYDAYGRRNY